MLSHRRDHELGTHRLVSMILMGRVLANNRGLSAHAADEIIGFADKRLTIGYCLPNAITKGQLAARGSPLR